MVRVVEDVSPECVKVIFPSGKIDLVNKSRVARLDALREGESAGRSDDDFDSVVKFDRSDLQEASPPRDHNTPVDKGRVATEDEERSPRREDRRGSVTGSSDFVEEQPRRSRRVRFRTLVYDAADHRDPQLLK